MDDDTIPAKRDHRWLLAVLAAAALIIFAMIALIRYVPHAISDTAVREQIVATIQREARASFLVTGSIDVTATITNENTRTLLPGLLDLGLGTSKATIQVPGRAYYGLDVNELDPKQIRISGDTIRMRVPDPHVFSVDANLEQLRVWTSKGWMRTPASVNDAERAAIRRVNATLARQAASYLANSAQPHINSAHALEKMLRPVLISAGIAQPHFQFELGSRLLME